MVTELRYSHWLAQKDGSVQGEKPKQSKGPTAYKPHYHTIECSLQHAILSPVCVADSYVHAVSSACTWIEHHDTAYSVMLLSSGWLPGTVIFWGKGLGHWTINLILLVLMLKAQAQIDQVNAHLVLHHPEGNCS